VIVSDVDTADSITIHSDIDLRVTGPTFRDRCSIPVSDGVAHRTWLLDEWQWMSSDCSAGRGARYLWQPVTGLHLHMSSVLSIVLDSIWYRCLLIDELLWFSALFDNVLLVSYCALVLLDGSWKGILLVNDPHRFSIVSPAWMWLTLKSWLVL